MKLIIDSNSQNEAFARTVVAAYITRLDPTLEELADVKTAVSEAVTNSILHGYNNGEGLIEITCEIKGQEVFVEITDHGVGIPDIEKAMEPLYTTKPEYDVLAVCFHHDIALRMLLSSLCNDTCRTHMKSLCIYFFYDL